MGRNIRDSQPSDLARAVSPASVKNSSGDEPKYSPHSSPRVLVRVKGEPAIRTTLREFVMLVALTDEESEALLAGDSVAIANGWTVERVKDGES